MTFSLLLNFSLHKEVNFYQNFSCFGYRLVANENSLCEYWHPTVLLANLNVSQKLPLWRKSCQRSVVWTVLKQIEDPHYSTTVMDTLQVIADGADVALNHGELHTFSSGFRWFVYKSLLKQQMLIPVSSLNIKCECIAHAFLSLKPCLSFML